ncbi:hypothetical protein JOQ06_025255 [Pogonophryne albipinna]|uniref:Uncharacterized protein n=1 Tax=Pogonophryne albipinna TaxID=1090488 RepID=A0AAD6ATY6_9TELE|nr:hypothetical protein JOQ06_025255 [Pogonophryne albipinna]
MSVLAGLLKAGASFCQTARAFSTGTCCQIKMHAIPALKKVDRWTEKRSMYGVYDNIGILGTRLPEKGPTTGSIIGAIIGVILLLAIIGTAIAMYRKHRNKKLTGDGPPKHKPPPPKKTTSSASTHPNISHVPVAGEDGPLQNEPLQNEYYDTQSAEPVTDLDVNHDDDDHVEDVREHYHSAAPSGWDDPGNNEVPPPYMRTDSDPQDYHPAPNVSHGESFVSTAMFV